MQNNQTLSGKEDFIRQAKQDPSLLKLPITRDILGKDFDKISQEITEQDNPDVRIDYGRKLARLGYSHEQIKTMPMGEAKRIIDKAQQIKSLTGIGYSPAEIKGMSAEYIKQLLELLGG